MSPRVSHKSIHMIMMAWEFGTNTGSIVPRFGFGAYVIEDDGDSVSVPTRIKVTQGVMMSLATSASILCSQTCYEWRTQVLCVCLLVPMNEINVLRNSIIQYTMSRQNNLLMAKCRPSEDEIKIWYCTTILLGFSRDWNNILSTTITHACNLTSWPLNTLQQNGSQVSEYTVTL